MKIEITQEEYDQLRQKAQAWDAHVHHRLEDGGEVPCKTEITCVEGRATLRINDRVIVTPFGRAIVHDQIGGHRDFTVQVNDSVILDSLVQLRIS